MGKKMRADVVAALRANSHMQGVDVACTNEPNTPHEAFASTLAAMRDALFCLALPGDAPSTRRLTEIFMAGCGTLQKTASSHAHI